MEISSIKQSGDQRLSSIVPLFLIGWLLAACAGVASQAALQNCSVNNGTWHNNTCLYPSDQLYDVISNLSTTEVKPVPASDEYFQ